MAAALLAAFAVIAATPALSCLRGSSLEIGELLGKWTAGAGQPAGGIVHNGQLISAYDGGCGKEDVVRLNNAIAAVIGDRGIILLGEVHDNPEHHRLRAELVSRFFSEEEHYIRQSRMLDEAEGKPPSPAVRRSSALVLEHIRADQQSALDRFRRDNIDTQHTGTPAQLFELLEWDKSGWPDKAIFEPLFKVALDRKLPILPGEPARDAVRKVAREGESALSPEERARLKLDVPLEPSLQDALLTELEQSHCGMMPKSAFGNMAFAQRYRDAHMADALVKAQAANQSAILLAGNGHVRSDRGVPWYLRKMAPQVKTLSVLLLEVEDGKTDPETYGLRDAAGQPIADFVVFTPRQARPDPCEEMRKRMTPRKP